MSPAYTRFEVELAERVRWNPDGSQPPARKVRLRIEVAGAVVPERGALVHLCDKPLYALIVSGVTIDPAHGPLVTVRCDPVYLYPDRMDECIDAAKAVGWRDTP